MEELKYELQKLGSKEQEEVRKKIVRQMKKHGDVKEVAEICECTIRHVNKTWKKYKDGGCGSPGASPSRISRSVPISSMGQAIRERDDGMGQAIRDRNDGNIKGKNGTP